MPVYCFRCDDEKSPYKDKNYEILMTIKEYEEKKDKIKCPITGSPMKPVLGGGTGIKFNCGGFYGRPT